MQIPQKQAALGLSSKQVRAQSAKLALPSRAKRSQLKCEAIAEPPSKPKKVASPAQNGAPHGVEDAIVSKLRYQFGKNAEFTTRDTYHGTAWSVREQLIDAFDKTHQYWE